MVASAHRRLLDVEKVVFSSAKDTQQVLEPCWSMMPPNGFMLADKKPSLTGRQAIAGPEVL